LQLRVLETNIVFDQLPFPELLLRLGGVRGVDKLLQVDRFLVFGNLCGGQKLLLLSLSLTRVCNHFAFFFVVDVYVSMGQK
jgi:hypothetical protein